MGARIPVTPATLLVYLGREMTAANYHLLYGLSLLPTSQFDAVADALLNAEASPEDLVRLGSFSAAEADVFIRDFLGAWTRAGVGSPSAGTPGWGYLADTLGLSALLRAARDAAAPAVPARCILGTRLAAGAAGEPSAAEVDLTFLDLVIPGALAGAGLASLDLVLPASAADLAALPVPNETPDRRAQFTVWLGLFGPLLDPPPDPGTACSLLFAVGTGESALRRNPGLAQFILGDTRPHQDTQLLMRREAAVRCSSGPLAPADVQAMLAATAAARPSWVATGITVAALDFALTEASAAIAAAPAGDPTWAPLSPVCAALTDALQAVFDHRDRLRAFLTAAYSLLPASIPGTYPA